MSSLKYPFAEGTVKAIVEVYRMSSPMCTCTRCGHKHAVPKGEFHRARGPRCPDCGGPMEPDRKEVNRRKGIKAGLADHAIHKPKKRASSDWTVPIPPEIAPPERKKKPKKTRKGYRPLPHATPGSTVTESVRKLEQDQTQADLAK